VPHMAEDASQALAEGFFWMAEKLRYGYENVAVDSTEALKLYRQAAALGFPRAYLRIGEMHERGIGTPTDAAEAFSVYRRAAEAGEITAYAALARLVSRSSQAAKADALWEKFFVELASTSHPDLGANEPAASIHAYLFWKLAHYRDPAVFPVMSRYRTDLIRFMQQHLEHVSDAEQLDIMQTMIGGWVSKRLPE
jgi:TPR repeat protein